MEEVVLKLLFGDEIGRLVLEVDEHPQGAGIGLLRALPLAVELKGFDHSLMPLGIHDTSPFTIRMDSPIH
jgi:hypothetical protein